MCISAPKPPAAPPSPPPPVSVIAPELGSDREDALTKKRMGKRRLQIPIGTFDNPSNPPRAGLGIRG